jgi:hypothetical protein
MISIENLFDLYFAHQFSFPEIQRGNPFTVNKIKIILSSLFIRLLIMIIDIQVRICFLQRFVYMPIHQFGCPIPAHFLFLQLFFFCFERWKEQMSNASLNINENFQKPLLAQIKQKAKL